MRPFSGSSPHSLAQTLPPKSDSGLQPTLAVTHSTHSQWRECTICIHFLLALVLQKNWIRSPMQHRPVCFHIIWLIGGLMENIMPAHWLQATKCIQIDNISVQVGSLSILDIFFLSLWFDHSERTHLLCPRRKGHFNTDHCYWEPILWPDVAIMYKSMLRS